ALRSHRETQGHTKAPSRPRTQPPTRPLQSLEACELISLLRKETHRFPDAAPAKAGVRSGTQRPTRRSWSLPGSRLSALLRPGNVGSYSLFATVPRAITNGTRIRVSTSRVGLPSTAMISAA